MFHERNTGAGLGGLGDSAEPMKLKKRHNMLT